MSKIISIKCNACGAPLEALQGRSSIQCMYCGSDNLLVHEVGEGLSQLSPSLDRTASELAIKRLKEELADMDASAQSQLENLEVEKNRALSEIEKKKSIALSSPVPAIDELKGRLNALQQERARTLKKGKTRLGFLAFLNTSAGLAGGCATFIVSLIVVTFFSAIVAGIVQGLTGKEYSFDVFTPYLLIISTVIALISFAGYMIFAGYRRRKLSQKISAQQHELEQAITAHQKAIVDESTRNIQRINADLENQKRTLKENSEATKASITREISERQEQLEKHYKRVKI